MADDAKWIVAFSNVMGARWYFLKRIRRDHGHTEFELVAESWDATPLEEKEANDLAKAWGAVTKPKGWVDSGPAQTAFIHEPKK